MYLLSGRPFNDSHFLAYALSWCVCLRGLNALMAGMAPAKDIFSRCRLEVGIKNLMGQLCESKHMWMMKKPMTLGLSGCDPRSIYGE